VAVNAQAELDNGLDTDRDKVVPGRVQQRKVVHPGRGHDRALIVVKQAVVCTRLAVDRSCEWSD
jgi:hypothetical protein